MLTRRLKKLLCSQEGKKDRRPFHELTNRFNKNSVGVRFFYIIQFVIFFIIVRQSLRLNIGEATLLASGPNFIVSGIYSLVTIAYPKITVLLISLIGFLSLFLVLIRIHFRWVKIVYACSLFVLLSVNLAMGVTQIGNIIWLWLATLFCFLPSSVEGVGEKTRDFKARYNLICFSSLVLVLSCYSLSGIWKFIGSVIVPFFTENISLFNPDSLSYLVSHFLITYRHKTVLGEFATNMSVFGQLSLWLVLYLQLFAVFAAFRSKILVPWVAGLTIFHVINLPLLNLSFEFQTAALLFVTFAFTNAEWPKSWKDFFFSLPVLRYFLRKVSK